MPDFGIRYQESFYSNIPMQRPDLSSWISCLSYKCCSKQPTDSSHSRTFQELITGIWSCSGATKTAKHYIYASLFPRFFKPFWSIVAFSLYYLMLIVKPKIAPEAAFKVFPRPILTLTDFITLISITQVPLSLRFHRISETCCSAALKSHPLRTNDIALVSEPHSWFGLARFWVSQQLRLHQDRQLTSVNALISF